MRKTVLLLFMIASLLMVSALVFAGGAKEEGKGPIIVGSKEFTEQILLGKITLLALENAGFTVVDKTGLGGTSICRGALENGDIDIYWEYTGTALMAALGHEKPITNPKDCFDVVKKEDLANGVVWLPMAPLNNTYTLMMTQSAGKEKGVESLSDLAAYVKSNPDVILGTDHEFYIRPDGIKGLEKVYGFEFDESKVVTLDWGLVYKSLKDGQVDIAMGFATDGRISAFKLFNLEDNKKYFPVYNPAPNVRKSVFDSYPEIEDVLGEIAAKLDTATMTELNKKVDVDEIPLEKVASAWLKENGFID